MKSTLLPVLMIALASLVTSGAAHAVTGKTQATYYHDKFDGRATASGERLDQRELTAAHKTLAFGTRVEVTHLETNRSVVVEVNDRIPHRSNTSIDLTKSAARELGILRIGRADVRLKILGLAR